jgi:hypothetical protein
MNIRKYILPSALILGLAGGIALAQNYTRALQLSPDTTGAFLTDINNGVYFPGHILSSITGIRPLPAVSSCGTGSPAVVGSDTSGKITTGSGASTSCVLTFGTAYVTAPACQMSTTVTNAGPLFLATTTTTATFNYASATSLVVSYTCLSAS